MKIVLKKGDEIISTPIPADEVMVRPKKPKYKKTSGLVVKISGGHKIECKKEEEVLTPPAVECEQTNPEETKVVQEETITPPVEQATTADSTIKSDTKTDEEVDKEEEKDVEFYTKSNFIRDDEKKEEETTDTTDIESEDNKSEDEKVEDAKKVETPTPKKSTVAKKSSTTKKVVNTKPEAEIPKDNTDLEDKYAQYDTDDEPSYQPIRTKKKSSVERDANGRFVSSGNSGKKKTNRIPSK